MPLAKPPKNIKDKNKYKKYGSNSSHVPPDPMGLFKYKKIRLYSITCFSVMDFCLFSSLKIVFWLCSIAIASYLINAAIWQLLPEQPSRIAEIETVSEQNSESQVRISDVDHTVEGQ
jgi:hypothetical protein